MGWIITHDVTVVSTWYWHCRDAMPVLLECICPCCQDMVLCQQGAYVGVVGTGCWHCQDVVGVIGTGCWCHQDTVSVSSGRGVRVIGTWCWRHRGAVSVLVSSGGRGPHHGHLRVCYVLEALIFIFHLLTNTFSSHDLFPPPFHHMTCSHPFSIT